MIRHYQIKKIKWLGILHQKFSNIIAKRSHSMSDWPKWRIDYIGLFTSDPERAKWRKDYNYGRALQVGSASNNDAYEMITRAFSKTSRTPVAVTEIMSQPIGKRVAPN